MIIPHHRRQSWGIVTPRFCDGRSWGLHEILYPIMYRNMRWKHFLKWWLIRDRKICVYIIKFPGMIPSILCYVFPPVELLGLKTPDFKPGPTTPSFQTRLTPLFPTNRNKGTLYQSCKYKTQTHFTGLAWSDVSMAYERTASVLAISSTAGWHDRLTIVCIWTKIHSAMNTILSVSQFYFHKNVKNLKCAYYTLLTIQKSVHQSTSAWTESYKHSGMH